MNATQGVTTVTPVQPVLIPLAASLAHVSQDSLAMVSSVRVS